MPAKRLPWYKVWAEHTEHPKICELSDGQYRTWQYVLAKASQQPERWTFASARHAATVTGRPLAHVHCLITYGLLDETPEGLIVHNGKRWQDKYPSDYSLNAAATLPESSESIAGNAAGIPISDPEGDRPPNVGLTDPEEEPKELAKARSKSERLSEEFELFWRTYPSNNGSKPNSLRTWKTLSAADRMAALKGAENYALAKKGEPRRFVKHADGWLTGRFWEAHQDPPPAETAKNVTPIKNRPHEPSEENRDRMLRSWGMGA